MIRVYSFLMMLTLCSLSVHAQFVTPEAAKRKAAEFLSARSDEGDGPSKVRKKIDPSTMRVTDASASIYAVNVEDEAFVLVPKNGSLDDVLGYCDNGAFDADNMPENFRVILHDMEQEVAILSEAENDEAAKSIRKATRKAISPMINSRWNQGEANETGNVFNCQCPKYTYSNGVSYYCYTGCVATAMAQLMYFYKYPTTTKKTIPAYTSNSSIGYLSSLEVTTFDWGSMQDEYLGTELVDLSSYRAMAISKLMKYCGYAAQMNYGTGGSMASDQKMVNALIEYFGYNPNAYSADRTCYTLEEWDNLIYNELSAGRPVLYSGSSTSVGHQFIVDGIDSSGKFHVNWGWGGQYDGYYLINVLNPHTTTSAGSSKTPDGYTIDQMAVIGMQPAKTAVLTGPTVVTAKDNGSNVAFDFYNRTNAVASMYLGIGVISNGSVTKTLTTSSVATSFNPNQGWGDYGISYSSLAAYLSAGTYKVSVIYSLDGKTWYPCAGSDMNYVDVTVANNAVKSCVVHPLTPSLSAFSAKLTTNGYVNVPQEVEVSILNGNSDNFTGVVTMYADGVQTTNAGVYLAPGVYDKLYFYFTPTHTGAVTLEFVVIDPYTNAVLADVKGKRTVQITEGPDGQVEATLISPEAKTISGKNYVYDVVTQLEIDVYNNTRNTVDGYIMLKRDDQYSWVYWNPTISPYTHRLLTNRVEGLVMGKTYTYSVYYSENSTDVDEARKLCSYTFTVTDSHKVGDVNDDGKVDISDIVAIINHIAGTASYKYADVNADNKVDISDIVAVINIIAGSSGDSDWRHPTL